MQLLVSGRLPTNEEDKYIEVALAAVQHRTVGGGALCFLLCKSFSVCGRVDFLFRHPKMCHITNSGDVCMPSEHRILDDPDCARRVNRFFLRLLFFYLTRTTPQQRLKQNESLSRSVSFVFPVVVLFF